MNNDIYAEWLVKRKNPWYRIPYFLLVGVLALVVVLFTIRNSWGIVALAALIVGVMFTYRYLQVEYEYVFVTSELSIDAIYSQQIRKTKKRIEMGDVESVEPTNEQALQTKKEDKGIVFEDYSSKEQDAKTYTITYSEKGSTHILVFEPNDKLLRAMWRCSPSKVKIPAEMKKNPAAE